MKIKADGILVRHSYSGRRLPSPAQEDPRRRLFSSAKIGNAVFDLKDIHCRSYQDASCEKRPERSSINTITAESDPQNIRSWFVDLRLLSVFQKHDCERRNEKAGFVLEVSRIEPRRSVEQRTDRKSTRLNS